MVAVSVLGFMADAFGRMVYDYHHGQLAGDPVHRRDDGVTWDAPLDPYFAPPEEWSTMDFEILSHFEGDVLDLGCGAGRHSLYLQDQHNVVAVDRSPLTVQVARDRGVDHVAIMDLFHLGVGASFENLLVAGGQLGIPGSLDGLRKLLDRLKTVTDSDGRLVADLLDPTGIDDPDRRSYLHDNQIGHEAFVRRFRVEYDSIAGPWIDLLVLSPDAFRGVVADTSWRVTDLIDCDGSYTAVLER